MSADAPAAPLRLRPSLRRYDWGDPRFIPALLGQPISEAPCAEAWFGAHPLAPAQAELPAGQRPLDAVISDHAEALLGPQVTARYGRLPYLFKLLAAQRPLSIQVHPDRAQAEAGFAAEEAEGIPRDAPQRRYRDDNHKPELLVALTPFDALVGFRPRREIAGALDSLPELSALLPAYEPGPKGLRALLEAWFALPEDDVAPALRRLLQRLETDAAAPGSPEAWALHAHRVLGAPEQPDRGLLFVFLLAMRHLEPGQGIYLPAGVPHAYLQGAGVELMASSDNVLRAGLTSKHVDPAELLRVMRYDAGRPPLLAEPPPHGLWPTPASEFELCRMPLRPEAERAEIACGPETLFALPDSADTEVTVRLEDGTLTLRQGEACLMPDGTRYEVQAPGSGWLLRTRVPGAREEGSRDEAETRFVASIRRNVAGTEALFELGEPAQVLATVCGSAAAKTFWQQRLERARPLFRAREALSFHEDLPVNQAFGLLLLWQRLRPHLRPGEGALCAFVFGEGTRAAPLTEAESGQKPAIDTFVATGNGSDRRYLSTVELALRYFAPVESYLRRSGFDGIVVKWGDEVQIPTRDLTGTDPRLAGADVVRFVSLREITADEAENKDWVGVDAEGRITTFIPRRPLAQMDALAERGLVQRRDGALFGGINLGSIALSRRLLDALLEELQTEVNDPDADRRQRPDLDPQLFTALTIAAIADPAERDAAWEIARRESAAMQTLAERFPAVLTRLRRALDNFEANAGRPVRMVAMDFEDQYWGDIGQHRQMRELVMALRERDARGAIARTLAGIGDVRDADGNIIVGDTRLGPDVQVRDSVLIDAHIAEGDIRGSVLVGTHCAALQATDAFDIGSTVTQLRLDGDAGSYKVVSSEAVQAGPAERVTSVFLPEGSALLRVSEHTDLRDRAGTYAAPILDNAVSFADLHERVVQIDPAQLDALRADQRREVEALIATRSDVLWGEHGRQGKVEAQQVPEEES